MHNHHSYVSELFKVNIKHNSNCQFANIHQLCSTSHNWLPKAVFIHFNLQHQLKYSVPWCTYFNNWKTQSKLCLQKDTIKRKTVNLWQLKKQGRRQAGAGTSVLRFFDSCPPYHLSQRHLEVVRKGQTDWYHCGMLGEHDSSAASDGLRMFAGWPPSLLPPSHPTAEEYRLRSCSHQLINI